MTLQELELEKRILHRQYMVRLHYNDWIACEELTKKIKDVEKQMEAIQ